MRMLCHSGQWTMVQWMTYWLISKAPIFIRRILSEKNAMDICKSSAMEDVPQIKGNCSIVHSDTLTTSTKYVDVIEPNTL